VEIAGFDPGMDSHSCIKALSRVGDDRWNDSCSIVYPLSLQTNVDANLMVLSIGAGSLFCSHVNDTGFWIFKEYFGISVKDTFRSWSVMESIVSVVGLIGVLVINQFL
jgi:Gnt-I system high-affinity gluconate transporter